MNEDAMTVAASEIVGGIVVHVDPQKLIAQGGCQTTAFAGYETQRPHFFLVTSVDLTIGECLCTPLLSEKQRRSGSEWIELDQKLKSGRPEYWVDRKSYYFKWQFWKVPASAFESASATDNSDGDRRYYAKDDPNALAALSAHVTDERHPWRELNSN